MRLLKWIGLILLTLIVVLVIAGTAIGWWLSSATTPESLARMAKSPQHKDGKFVNIEPEAGFELSWDMFSNQFFGEQQREPIDTIPVVAMDPKGFESQAEHGLRIAWIGHATALLEIGGKRILTDPVFSERVSPFSMAGPRRFHPPPIALEELTGIDGVVISHNHYDHLDKATIKHLATQGTRFFVPLGIKAILQKWDVPDDLIEEMDWWQEARLDDITIVATPARHYSSRGTFDFQKTLWASWSIISPQHRAFFSGDSGYSKSFAEIGEKLGPFDVSIIKVGAYGPSQNWKDIHMPPEESIQVHKDIRAKAMLPVHWGTFNLAYHDWKEPIERTVKSAKEAGVTLITPRVGELVDPTADGHSKNWWQDVK